jgi:hypothetical protein
MPFQGFRVPLNISGKRRGMMTASFRAYLALDNPATSSQLTFGFYLTMACSKLFFIYCF